MRIRVLELAESFRSFPRPFAATAAVPLLIPSLLEADTVRFREGREIVEVEGNVLAEDRVGTVMLEGRDGAHYFISSDALIERKKAEKPTEPYTKLQLRAALERELGPRFRFDQTKHYLVAYSCAPEYAQQASSLFERAFSVFTNYFSRRGGFRFTAPKQPLVAIICSSREEYVKLLSKELGPLAASTAGVYMPTTNRMYMYDALGGETAEYLRTAPKSASAPDGFALLLREQNVSTIVHESIHQIAYNSGFHNRHVRNPVWLVEGMATFFETPDLDAKGGWGGVGNVNRERLERFQQRFSSRPKDSLRRLILDDTLFRQPDTANDAYAEAWALTYFLCKAKSKSYVEYLKILNARPPMVEYSAEDRVRDFRTAFGKSPEDVDTDFRKYMSRVMFK
ncbi:MAG: DUF1570 domain-containing protein [Planctomycetota bacterium]